MTDYRVRMNSEKSSARELEQYTETKKQEELTPEEIKKMKMEKISSDISGVKSQIEMLNLTKQRLEKELADLKRK